MRPHRHRNGDGPVVFDDPESLARAVAERIVSAAAASLERRGEFRLVLSGGRTPGRAYQILARDFRGAVDWGRTTILFADERAVPPDDPESNYRLVRETLLVPAGIADGRVRRMRGEAVDLDAAAREYEPFFEPAADLLLLGVGPDGHTASIFPGSTIANEIERRVMAVWNSAKPPPRRLTITPRVIGEARAVAVLAVGEEKAEVVARAIDRAEDPLRLPAALLKNGTWYLDRGAASSLARP